jgi:RNA recognition motif-containing protein
MKTTSPSGAVTHAAKTHAKLFVGQLPFECTEAALRDLFSHYGSIKSVYIIKRNGVCSGSAFVTFNTTAEADTAIYTLHERHFLLPSRPMQVRYADNSPNISEFGVVAGAEGQDE